MPRPPEFRPEDKIKMLLWSDRHCCLCKKACGVDIEIAHIDPDGGNNIENGMPACYECHAKIDRYNPKSKRGNKYRFEELRRRRDQVYEEYTRNLVSPILLRLTTASTPANPRPGDSLPFVATLIEHAGNSLPVRIRIETKVIIGNDVKDLQDESGYYTGKTEWNLNPHTTVFGGFSISQDQYKWALNEELKIEARITVIDQFEREHRLLPQCWRYARVKESCVWNLEPRSFAEWG
ncbi:MAG: HNH endonuclease signature motif containing protein [Candidatus Bathyarchaeia archaeon]